MNWLTATNLHINHLYRAGKNCREDSVGGKGCYRVDNVPSLAALLVDSLPEILE